MSSSPFKHLPKAQSAENNKTAIWNKLVELKLVDKTVFEVGSGTGQHGVYFCQMSETLTWYPSEVSAKLATLQDYYQVASGNGIHNFCQPQCYEIGMPLPLQNKFDLIYCANVLHIISKVQCNQLIQELSQKLVKGQQFVCYGPFKRQQQFTTGSNQKFETWLQQQGYGGQKDVEDIVVFSDGSLQINTIEDMPANNFLVVYQKQ